MTRFMLGVILGAMLMGSAVYAGDWFQDWQHNQLQQRQLQEQQRQNWLLQEHIQQQQPSRGFSGLDPC